MTRRLRTDRMRERAAMIRATHLLRESADEVRAAYERGEISRNGARAAFGFRPVRGRIGKERVHARAGTGWLPPAFGEVTFPDAFTDGQVAEWQRAWDETVCDDPQPQRLVWLPSRTVVRSERPRKSTPRGPARMREHTISLLLGALRSDGSYVAVIRVSTCRAMRVLPWDIGYEHTSRITAGDGKPTGYAAVEDAYREHVIEPALAHVTDKLGNLPELPEGATGWVVTDWPQGSQIEPDTNLPTPWVDPNGATEA